MSEAAEIHAWTSERERLENLGYKSLGTGMSNCDHSIDEGFEERLRAPNVYGTYAGWNFFGYVWFDGQQFACEVWVYRSPREVIRCDTLDEIISGVSNRYGSD